MKTFKILLSTILIMGLNLSFAQTARVQIIHNSADAAAEVVDVWLNTTKLIENFAFRTATPFIDAPAGVLLNIGIAPPNSTSWTQSFRIKQVSLFENQTYVVVANGIISGSGYDPAPIFEIKVYPVGREAASQSGNTDVLVVHGSTDAPTVDIFETGVGAGQIVNDLVYGNVAGYLELVALDYVLEIRDETGMNTVAAFEAPLATLGLQDSAIIVVASGFLNPGNNSNGPAFGLWVALPSGGPLLELPAQSMSQTARLQVIHNAADPGAVEVDIYLNGTLLLDNFGFREATPYIDAPAGTPINIGVAGPNSTSAADTIKNFNLTLTANETYVAIANGVLSPGSFASNPDGRSTAFTLFIKDMARENGTSSDVDFFVLHGSIDAPTVDVIARGVATLVDDAAYSDITGYITVPAGNYTLDLTLADGVTLVQSYIADLSTLGGGSAVVFASGFLTPSANQNGEAFELYFALADGTVGQFPEGVTSVEEISSITPDDFNLLQNYPNPFNPSTVISFNLAVDSDVSLKVFNILGQEVVSLLNNRVSAGTQQINFNAAGLSSGVYLYQLEAKGIDGSNFSSTRKMLLTK